MYTFAIAIRSPFYPVLEKVLSVFFLNHFDSQTDLRLEKYNHTAEPNKLVYVHKRKPVSVLYNCQLQQSPFPISPSLSPVPSLPFPGPAGLVCAETLRQEGFTDRIVMVTMDKHLPFDRPKLSKVCTDAYHSPET